MMLGPANLFYDRRDGWHRDITVDLSYGSQNGQSFTDSLTFSFASFEATRFDNTGKSVERSLEQIADNTKMFQQSPVGDGLFWRIWKSLLDSDLKLVATEESGSYEIRFEKGGGSNNGGRRGMGRVDFSGGRNALADVEDNRQVESSEGDSNIESSRSDIEDESAP
ncbi:hypothetical protein OP10G_2652 [Fimbriimonas ginsengisoli Gsoil 348]|uniref:Uncharacterized protein n=2 Tax=Fimbriimonas ginsengisoli TaxID=1005039 RepID=A0A068NTD2_FIMGI|nr:hypothetical protein OP10G_2652 [Fimbriimonas ginsengisoli Gsoil 348]